MNFVPTGRLVRDAFEHGYAVPSFCVWDAATMGAVLRVAADCRSPVILMNGPGEFGLLPPAVMARVARAVAADFDMPAALHLDHGDAPGQVRDCLDAGYTGVMLDYSTRPFEENAAALRRVVEWAAPLGVSTEGEIGAVGRIDEVTGEGTAASALTDPDEARRYVRETGIDMVAVSIGNAHGNYPVLPTLDFDLLAELRDAVGIPVVLHGGSGTPDEDLSRVISLGVAKVNVASELIRTVRQGLAEPWAEGRLPWVPEAMAEACVQLAPVIEKWIRRCGSQGMAE